MIPNNLEECFSALAEDIGPERVEKFKNMPEEDICLFHHNFGITLRNNWELWGDNALVSWFNMHGITHTDDMSSIILHSYHRYLNGGEILLDAQVAYYKEYWDNIKDLGNGTFEITYKTLKMVGTEVSIDDCPLLKKALAKHE